MAGNSPTEPNALDCETLHATTVAVGDVGVLIVGRSGCGKSSLALQLIALGAMLVADDRTTVRLRGKEIFASAPATIAGQIEARGIGLIQLSASPPVALSMVVDMGQLSRERLPPPQSFQILDRQLPCFHHVEGPHLASAILLLAKGGYLNPDDPI